MLCTFKKKSSQESEGLRKIIIYPRPEARKNMNFIDSPRANDVNNSEKCESRIMENNNGVK